MPICRSWYAANTGMGAAGGHKGRQFLIGLLSRSGLDERPVRLGMRIRSPDPDARTRSVTTMAVRRQRSRPTRCVASDRGWSARTSRLVPLCGCVRPPEPVAMISPDGSGAAASTSCWGPLPRQPEFQHAGLPALVTLVLRWAEAMQYTATRWLVTADNVRSIVVSRGFPVHSGLAGITSGMVVVPRQPGCGCRGDVGVV